MKSKHAIAAHKWYIKNRKSCQRRAILWVKAHPEWRSYNAARSRCAYPSVPGYKNYGGRGIQFLYRDFKEFLRDLGKKPSLEHTLDRINVNGHYIKGNCRWATRQEQVEHRRPLTYRHKRNKKGQFTKEVIWLS